MLEKKDLSFHMKHLYSRAIELIPSEQRYDLMLKAASIFLSVSDYENALDLVDQVISSSEFEKMGLDLRYRAYDLKHKIYSRQGKLDDALEILQKGKELAENLNDSAKLCRTFVKMGNIYLKKNDHDKAKEYYLKALDIGEEINDSLCLSSIYNNLAVYEVAIEGDQDKAQIHFQKALSLYETINPSSVIIGRILTNLGNLFKSKGIYDKAQDYFQRAHTIASSLYKYDLLGHIYHGKAELYFEIGELDVAWIFATKALDFYKLVNGSEGGVWMAQTYLVMAKIKEKMGGNFEVVVNYLHEAEKLLIEAGEKKELAMVYKIRGDLAHRRGLRREAVNAYNRALEIAKDIKDAKLIEQIESNLKFL